MALDFRGSGEWKESTGRTSTMIYRYTILHKAKEHVIML
jgi:hypothetical protein